MKFKLNSIYKISYKDHKNPESHYWESTVIYRGLLKTSRFIHEGTHNFEDVKGYILNGEKKLPNYYNPNTGFEKSTDYSITELSKDEHSEFSEYLL